MPPLPALTRIQDKEVDAGCPSDRDHPWRPFPQGLRWEVIKGRDCPPPPLGTSLSSERLRISCSCSRRSPATQAPGTCASVLVRTPGHDHHQLDDNSRHSFAGIKSPHHVSPRRLRWLAISSRSPSGHMTSEVHLVAKCLSPLQTQALLGVGGVWPGSGQGSPGEA